MTDCSKNKNPLVRSGMNRKERVLPAIDANYALPDENGFAQWMVYSRNLAAHIKYFRSTNEWINNENWQPFFDSDVSAQLALLAVQNVNDYKDRIRALFDSIKSEDFKNDAVKLKTNFGLLYGGILSLAYRLDYFQKILPDDVPLKSSIRNLVQVKLAPTLHRLLGYYRAANKYGPQLILESVVDDWVILAYKQEAPGDILTLGFSDIWPDWNDGYDDNTIYNHEYADVVNDADVWPILNHAVNHNLFSNLFAEFLSAYARIVNDSEKQLINAITLQNTHEPHYALYLTFLHLFKQAQNSLNTYTQRHLDYYYKEILQLAPKPSEPNHVHIAFELANLKSEYMVTKGTAFKAGKDSLGKDVIYKSDEDIILNKSIVGQLRTFYRAVPNDIISGASVGGNLYASPVANSADGIGGKLTTSENDWHPFVSKTFQDGALTGIQMPLANIGFAFASHYLFLQEGKRTITITWHGTSLSSLNGKQFDCYLTTEKNWLFKSVTISASSSTASITIAVLAGDAPITAYIQKTHTDPTMHQHIFQNVDTPVIKFLLKNLAPNDQYEALKDICISSIDIKVNVGSATGQNNTDGIKQLLIATDSGVVDPAKPFIPFGQNPKKGAGLVFGNKEVFSKANTKIILYLEWAEMTQTIQDMDVNLTNEFFPSAQLKFLENGVWKDGPFKSILNSQNPGTDNGEVELFWGANSIMMPYAHLPSSMQTIPAEAISNYKDDYTNYNIASQTGFMKLQLNADFQWDTYYMNLQLYLISKAKDGSGTEPKKPYLPKLQSVHLSYESSTTISFSTSDTDNYIHLYPFGTDIIDSAHKVSGSIKLMPQFIHACSDAASGYVPNQAEFYIGLQNVVPAQKVNLLFKVLDGSTDPLQHKPNQHVLWSYLSNNAWVEYEKTEVNDTTQQLITTGVISFPIPDDATNTNTLLPSGFHWLRAAITGLPEEVCRLIDVKAQVVEATFFDQQNAADFLSKPLPANTISKLLVADPAIKKISQPYSSFGGRYVEDTPNFYTRVSERLRHKNRAITIRDIEQLVLEKFEDIHKVKCLNHTKPLVSESAPGEEKCSDIPKPVTGATSIGYNELAPGHVTVITIPDLRNKNAINPLRPYTSTNRLKDIEDFLLARANCNMKWHIRNPQFEEVLIDTTIILTDAAAGNDAYYIEQLKEDLIKYLTPWAYDLNTDIRFGGKLSKSTIINFIEERAYVDVILDLKMFEEGEIKPVDEITASSWSILVAAAIVKQKVYINKKPVIVEAGDCK
jgi:hypothetical protein